MLHQANIDTKTSKKKLDLKGSLEGTLSLLSVNINVATIK